MTRRKKASGFSLIEVIVAVAVFVLFALGIYSAIVTSLKASERSRVQLQMAAALNEEFEIIRNLAYADVGIIDGVPGGVLVKEKSVWRSGVAYRVTTTVRNIDDPFDGTINGSPKDTAPADYKSVEMTISCGQCAGGPPLTLVTRVAPKNLENSSQNGSLFITVSDANGLPVPDASIHIVNNLVSPKLDFTDTSDSKGELAVIDTPASTLGYDITVTKDGYSSDYTVRAGPGNPNPVKSPATVASQSTTYVSFAIDRTGSLNLLTLTAGCAAVPATALRWRGDKLVGSLPDVYKYDQNINTDSEGVKNFPIMEWDSYQADLAGTSNDLAGSIPMLPTALAPGGGQSVKLLVVPHTASTLLVKVKDAGTGLPLSGATVKLVSQNYAKTALTGLGYILQTDWSGGGGQSTIADVTKYFSDSGAVDVNSPAGDVKLRKSGNQYLPSGWLESSTFALTSRATFDAVRFTPTASPPEAGDTPVQIQIASGNSPNNPNWNFLGPDGTSNTYYSAARTSINQTHSGDRYLRYRLYLSTADAQATPAVSEISITYTNGCDAPGQTFFGDLAKGAYTLEVAKSGYDSSNSQLEINGNGEVEINMSPL